MKPYLQLINAQPRLGELQFTEPVHWTLREGEIWAVVGPNGAGKSILSGMIAGKYPLKSGGEIRYDFGTEEFRAWRDVQVLAFDSVYGLADFRNAYYQQRWHSSENDDMPAVGELLKPDADPEILGLFGVDAFRKKKVNYLSSGELRKFLITKALLEQPKLLIIDNPYIGLDAASRNTLREALRNLAAYSSTQVIFILSDPADIPDFATHVLPIHGMTAGKPVPFRGLPSPETENRDFKASSETPEPVAELKNVTIRYGRKTVLEGIDWRIGRGEKWVLTGPNGSGKSTLLSLIHADHPQAYANDITLFGRKRGPGQSIWEIKKRIGYVSPEMHTHYYRNIPAADVVASGLFDTIGTVHRCNDEQSAKAIRWMRRFGIDGLRDRSFTRLSSGEQRLALLARAFVKEPELLILDEPLHGLDRENKALALDIIEDYASQPNVTLIYVTHYTHEIPPCVDKQFTLK